MAQRLIFSLLISAAICGAYLAGAHLGYWPGPSLPFWERGVWYDEAGVEYIDLSELRRSQLEAAAAQRR